MKKTGNFVMGIVVPFILLVLIAVTVTMSCEARPSFGYQESAYHEMNLMLPDGVTNLKALSGGTENNLSYYGSLWYTGQFMERNVLIHYLDMSGKKSVDLIFIPPQ